MVNVIKGILEFFGIWKVDVGYNCSTVGEEYLVEVLGELERAYRWRKCCSVLM